MEKTNRLTLLMRDPRPANHSIERLFAAIKPYFEKNFAVKTVVVPCQPSGFFALWANIRHARKHSEGLIHITGDAQYLATFLPWRRTILTIHDCGYLMKLKGIKRFIYKWLWFKLPCMCAARITVISDSTRQVLEREVGNFGAKLSVIENCVTIDLKPTKRKFNSSCPRILQIGSGRHKNLDNLIRAVIDLPCELKIVGKISEEDLQSLNEASISFTSEFAVSDERLAEIYQECDILFFASRHEGFGLPTLEAQAVGMPVITSNRYSMPFVAGKGAILVDPESPEEIRKAILQIGNDEIIRRDLVAFGFENIKRFSAKSVAEKYTQVYSTLI